MSGDVDDRVPSPEGEEAAEESVGEAAEAADAEVEADTAAEAKADLDDAETGSGPAGSVADEVEAEAAASTGAGLSPTELVGAGLLGMIPVALLSVPIAGLLRVSGASATGVGTRPLALGLAAIVGIGASAVLGPVLVGRSLRGLPEADSIDAVEDRVAAAAAARGLEPPEVRFVDADAATVAVVDSLSETTIVVPTRIRELDDDAQAAVLDHALARLETRNAALTTALLAPALLVEAWALLGLELARRREEPEEDDRLPQMLGAGDREEREVPWVAYAVAGVLLLVVVAPLWVVFAAGDRLLVGGGRSRVDDHLATDGAVDGDAAPLADALTFARDARGDRDWPPTLDRLSLVGLADPATRGVRGTSRIELRIRLARLRARENLAAAE